MDPEDIVKAGIFQVMECRRVFQELTIEENLIAASYTQRDKAKVNRGFETVYN